MKKLFPFVFVMLLSVVMSSQPCLPGTTYFYTQEDIDNFQFNYPNCTEIEGFVLISGDNITNLNGLCVLTSIDDFWLQNMDSLTSLNGMHNVTSIGGDLYINNLPLLSDISGLSSLTYIGDRFFFWNNGLIINISALSNVTSIGRLNIFNNDALTDLTGIEYIEVDSLTDVYIADNDLLATCEVLSLCNYLKTTGADATIEDNAPGCNSPEEVQDSCEANTVIIPEQHIIDNFSFYPNPSHSTITIELPSQPLENTSLTISNTNGQQLITKPIKEPQTMIDISGLPSGVYFVKVVDDEKVMVQKVIKQ